MDLNPVLAALGTYPIATIQERARSLRESGRRVIDFSIGDPREPTAPFIVEALHEAVPSVSQYPTTTGLPRLRAAIAGWVQRRFGVAVDSDRQVQPTSGAKEAVFSTPLAFIDRGAARRTVVSGSPGYPIYERGALFAGADVHTVVLSGDFVLRADDVPPDVWERSRLLWICSPHNPTGSVTERADIEALYERCRSHDVLLLSDECYIDVYEEELHPGGPPSVLEVAGPDATGVLAYVSCSKRSGMTGYRTGAMVGDPEAIAALRQLRSATGTASPEFVQHAAIAAWDDDEHAVDRRRIFANKRAVLRKAFADLGFRTVGSEAGLYLWVEVGDDVAVTDALLESGVVVAPGRFFGQGGEGYIRLALVPTLEDCEASVRVLRECLS